MEFGTGSIVHAIQLGLLIGLVIMALMNDR